jgi:hypothetical protein
MAQGGSIGCLHRRLISLRQLARHIQKLIRWNFIRFWIFSTWPGRELGSEEWSSEVRFKSVRRFFPRQGMPPPFLAESQDHQAQLVEDDHREDFSSEAWRIVERIDVNCSTDEHEMNTCCNRLQLKYRDHRKWTQKGRNGCTGYTCCRK